MYNVRPDSIWFSLACEVNNSSCLYKRPDLSVKGFVHFLYWIFPQLSYINFAGTILESHEISLPCLIVVKADFVAQRYTGRKISANLNYVTVRGEVKMKGQGGGKTPYALSLAPPPPPLPPPRLATNVCICFSQRSSEVSCDKRKAKPIWNAVRASHIQEQHNGLAFHSVNCGNCECWWHRYDVGGTLLWVLTCN
jgi:hypothetical protein